MVKITFLDAKMQKIELNYWVFSQGSLHIIKEYKFDIKLSLEDVKEYKTSEFGI